MVVSAKKQSLVEVVYLKDRLDRFGRLTRRIGMTEFVTHHEANALVKAKIAKLSGVVDSEAMVDCSAKEEDPPSAESTPQESTKKLSRKEKKERGRRKKEERQRGKR
jgi:hypothetical protein